MGCCLFAILLAGMPRLGLLLWWVFQPIRVQSAFHSFIGPLLGLIFLPWTTIMFVLVAPGGVNGLDWVWLAIGLFADIATYVGNARARSFGTAG